jgi:beta-lactamase regulating signal transducer with metallopeptidase domain
MKKPDDVKKLSPEARNYWKEFGLKCLDNLASVKLWFFMLPFIVSTIVMSILIKTHLTFMKDAARAVLGNDYTLIAPIIDRMDIITTMFIAWCTFTVSLAGTVIVVRETFKIRKMTSLNYERRDNTEIIERIKP